MRQFISRFVGSGNSEKSGKRSKRAAICSAIESLELRVLMAQNTLGTALNLGAVGTSGSVSKSATLTSAAPNFFYKFEISSTRDVTESVNIGSGSAYFQFIWDQNDNGIVDNGDVLEQSGNTGGSASLHQRLPAGTYFANVINTSSTTPFSISIVAPAAPADPGNTLGSALSLGAVGTSGSLTHSDWVGAADSEDDYKFTISSVRDVTESLNVTTGSAYIQFISDQNGNGIIDNGDVLEQSGNTGGNASLHQRLQPGTYFERVIQTNPDTFYSVSVVAPAAAADPGNTLDTALSLGAVGTSGALTHSDWVGAADSEDDYKFTISSVRDVTESLNVTTGSAYIQFISDQNGNGIIDNGDVLEQSGNTGGNASLHQRLQPGTYFERVIQTNPDTFYSVSVVAPAAAADPGNTLDTALSLGAVGTSGALTHSDWIGAADSEDDYKFTISSVRDVTESLNVTTGSAYIQFIWDQNNNGSIDNGDVLEQSGNTGGSASLHQRLQPGTYFERVIQTNPDTFYSVSVVAPAAAADPGNTLDTAESVGAVNGNIPLSDWVGAADSEDDYKFTVGSSRLVTVSMEVNTGSAYLQLIHDVNGNGQIDNGDVVSQTGNTGGTVSIAQNLSSGTYYARVIQTNPDTFYDLSISSAVVQSTTVSVKATDATASFAGTDPGTFTISRTGRTAAALTVDYKLTGTAANGTDYTKLTSSVSIPAGKTSATVTVTPITGTAAKAAKTVILSISSESAYAINSTAASATINITGDNIPTLGITATDPDADEPGIAPATTGAFTFTRSTTTSAASFILTLSGTGVYGTDYTLTGYGATITVNKTTKQVTVAFATSKAAAVIVVTPINAKLAATATVSLGLASSTNYNILSGKGAATVTVTKPPV